MKKLCRTLNAFILMICCLCFTMALEVVTAKKFVSLEEKMLQKYVFTNASKHWNHYVRRLLYSSAGKILPNVFIRKESSVIITTYLHYSVQLVKKFLIKTRQVKNWQYSDYIPIVFSITDEKTVYEPLLKYRFMESTIGIITEIKINLHFTLHKHLHLNISVYYIYFSSDSFLQCDFGSLTIFSFGNFLSNNTHHSKYRYCGIVPSFILYSSSNKVMQEISINSIQMQLDSVISYGIIDFYKIMSYKLNATHSVPLKSVFEFVSSNSYLLQYELVVEGYERLLVLSNVSQYSFIEVFDGPGTLYNILEPFTLKGKSCNILLQLFKVSFFYLLNTTHLLIH